MCCLVELAQQLSPTTETAFNLRILAQVITVFREGSSVSVEDKENGQWEETGQ